MKSFCQSLALFLILPLLFYSLWRDASKGLLREGEAIDVIGTVDTDALPLESPALSVSARAAVLMTEDGRVIFGKNENEPMEMASCTKVMTAILAIEYLRRNSLDLTVTVSENAVGIEGSSIYLEKGERVALLDLVYALMLASANDAAVAIAEAVCGDEAGFVARMNEKAAELGLCDTHFDNPHGLPSDTHYTTANSLARLFLYAEQDPLFARITATRQ